MTEPVTDEGQTPVNDTRPVAGTPADGTKNVQVLRVDKVSSGYGDVRALWNVSFSIGRGEFLGIVGSNGAGKSTLLRAIAGLNPLITGKIELGGESIGRLDVHQRIGRGLALVQEGKRVFRKLTVEDNLLLGCYSVTRRRSQIKPLVDEAYDRFPALASRRQERAGALSGGQQQMLAIAAAVMVGPKVLMLDEPSAGLAPSIVAEVLETVASLQKDGMTVILVEQSVETVVKLADQMLVLALGKVSLNLAADQISDADLIRTAYFGEVAPASSKAGS